MHRHRPINVTIAIAGAAPSGAFGCAPSRPVSLLHIGPTADATVAYNGSALYDGAVRSCERFLSYNRCPRRALPASASELWFAGRRGGTRTLDLLSRRRGQDTVEYDVGGCASDSRVTLWKMVAARHTPKVNFQYAREVVNWLQQ